MVKTIVATFLGCAMVTHWLLHTSVQIFLGLILELKKVWCCLFHFEYTNWSFCCDFLYNSITNHKF